MTKLPLSVIEYVIVLPVSESANNIGKGWPLHGQLMPTLQHERIRSLRTLVRDQQELSITDHFDGLRIGAARVRLAPIVENLPQTNAKRPHI